MKTIILSRSLVKCYQDAGMDISYVLSELSGMVSYEYCTQITEIPMCQQNKTEYLVEDDVYEELCDKFDAVKSVDVMAEIILWANYILGARL